MAQHYYISRNGRLSRKDNTLYFTREEEDKVIRTPIPIADVDSLYLYGEIDINTKALNFLAQHKIAAHIFNYHGNYSGSYYPREYMNSGFLIVEQVKHYRSHRKRMLIARAFIHAAVHGILRNLAYYTNRGRNLSSSMEPILRMVPLIDESPDISGLMGIEGRIRSLYYGAFNTIMGGDFSFERRVRNPPDNPINALISFGNSLCYAACLGEIYRTQLNPLISFLHEPGTRRYSLALDLSEIFKPLLVDRIIFKLVNQKMIGAADFNQEANLCYLGEKGRNVFVREWDNRLTTTIQHRKLGRKVSYQRLIRLECYKLIRHLTAMESYEGFRAWW